MLDDQSELASWLAELESEHATRALVIASIRQKLGLEGDAASPLPIPANVSRVAGEAPTGPLRSDTFFRLSIPDAIKKYLAMAKRPQSPKVIADALQRGGVLSQATNFYPNVTTALKRLRDAGEVVNTKEGWGLAQWYPNKPKQTDGAKPTKKTSKPKKKKATPAPTTALRIFRPKPATATPTPKTTYQEFLSARRKAGKSLKEIGAEWTAQKGATD